VFCTNLVPDTAYFDWHFSWCSSVLSGKCLNSTSIRPWYLSSKSSLIRQSFYHSTLYGVENESVIKWKISCGDLPSVSYTLEQRVLMHGARTKSSSVIELRRRFLWFHIELLKRRKPVCILRPRLSYCVYSSQQHARPWIQREVFAVCSGSLVRTQSLWRLLLGNLETESLQMKLSQNWRTGGKYPEGSLVYCPRRISTWEYGVSLEVQWMRTKKRRAFQPSAESGKVSFVIWSGYRLPLFVYKSESWLKNTTGRLSEWTICHLLELLLSEHYFNKPFYSQFKLN
jgi:hypothetical protein